MKQFLTIKLAKKDKKLESFLKSTKQELDIFFNLNVSDPIIFLLNSRKQMDLICERKTEEWEVGVTKNGMIFILDQKAFAQESSHKKEEFWQVLKHEYSHIYFRQITGGLYPLWFNEGLANYLAGQKKARNNPMDVFLYFDNSGQGVYNAGYFWVELLIRKFGKTKMKRLVHILKTGQKMTPRLFSTIFYKIYGFKFNKNTLAKLIK